MTVRFTTGPALKENSIIRHQTSLGQGSAVGKKGEKQCQIGKISASEARLVVTLGDVSRLRHPFPSPDDLSARFARRFFFSPTPIFSPFSPNVEPGPRLTPNRPYGYQSQELRLDLTINYFFLYLHVHVPGNASIRACTATFLVCDFSISDLGFLVSSRSFPLGHIASFNSSR